MAMKWYKIEANSPEALAKVRRSLMNQKLLVRNDHNCLYACVSDAHIKWLSDVVGDFNASFTHLPSKPEGQRSPKKEIYQAPCGEEIYDPLLYSRHLRYCPKCQPLISKEPKKERYKKPSKVVVGTLEPGQKLNLDGVIASLEITKDRMFERLEVIDKLITDLKVFRDSREKLDELQQEAVSRMQAVKMLINSGQIH